MEADKQESAGFLERSHSLRSHFQRSARLNDEQAQELKKASEGFQKDADLLKEDKEKIENAVSQSEETKNIDELKELYNQRGQLWSKQRNALRESFGAEKFHLFQEFLQNNLAAKIIRNSFQIKKNPATSRQILQDSSENIGGCNYSFSDIDYDEDSNTLSGLSVTWVEGNGGAPYFPNFNGGGSCDPEKSYCWNVEIGAQMQEPAGFGQSQSGYGCDGEVAAIFYPENEIESGEYRVYGDHRGAINLSPFQSCSMQGEDFFSNSEDSENVAVPKVDILLNSVAVTNTTQNVVIGQKISLSVQVTNGTPSNPQWTIPGNKVANYVVTYTDPSSPTSGVVTELTSQNLTQPTIDFYWVDGAESRQIRCSVKVRNRTYTAAVIFNVKSPTVSVTTVTTNTTISTNRQHQELLFGSIGNFGGGKFGITFTRDDFELPEGFTGNTIWVQVIDYAFKGTLTDGQTTKTASGSGLDGRFPYSSIDPDALITRDLPGVCLRICGSDTPSFRKMEARINADMWLMFKPSNLPNGANSIYVPLKKVRWNWMATAVMGEDFLFTLPANCCSNSENPPGESTLSFPRWNTIVTGKEPYQ